MAIKTSPQILKRVSVRWLPDPAYEDTETIALNVGGYFMDLRVVIEDNSVQWSRAGERRVMKTDPLTSQWTRIIDSTGSKQSDEAEFQELPNGEDLETGTFNKDGVLVPYEETWKDGTEGEGQAWILQSEDGLEFVGRVGRIFLGMRQSDGDFAVRKEALRADTWETEFESGSVEKIPKAADVVDLGQSQVGDKVRVLGEEYVIRGIDQIKSE